MAEMASMAPTTGASKRWTERFSLLSIWMNPPYSFLAAYFADGLSETLANSSTYQNRRPISLGLGVCSSKRAEDIELLSGLALRAVSSTSCLSGVCKGSKGDVLTLH